MKTKELAKNRRAYYDYEILETFEAGVSLLGSEVKSLREGGGSLAESYITIKENELYLINCYIAPYRFATSHPHEEKRKKKLLMHKKEIIKLKKELKEKGITIIPLAFYLKEGKVKLKIATAKGKKLYDKREKIKEKEEKRRIQQRIKGTDS